MKSFINTCFLLRIKRVVMLGGLNSVLPLFLLNFIGVTYAQQHVSAMESFPLPLSGEYRSVGDGDWDKAATWQEWTGTTWLPVNTFPSESSRISPVVAGWTSSTKTEESNEHTIDLPEDIEFGDLLLVFWTGAQTSGGNVSTPSGFKEIYFESSSELRRRRAWYKVSSGMEGPTINVRAGNGASAHTSYRIAAGTYAGIPEKAVPVAGNNSSPDPPILTSGFGAVPTLWIVASHSDGSASVSAPSGYSDLVTAYTGTEGNDGARIATAHMVTTNEESQDPGSFDLDLYRYWAANTIAIQGAPRKAVIQNGHAVTVTNNLSVLDVDVSGTLNVNTDREMTIQSGSTLIVWDGGRLRLPGHNTERKDARITGKGNFTLSEGSYLEIGSANGITHTGSATTGSNGEKSGNIRVSGIRTFHAGAHYIYNRVGFSGNSNNQSLGTGYPDKLTGSLTIDNPGTVWNTSSLRTINAGGTLNLIQGVFVTTTGTNNYLAMGSNKSTLATVNRSGGELTGTLLNNNWYQVRYLGDSKTTGSELLGDGLRNLRVDLADRYQVLTLDASRSIPGTLTLKTGLVNTGSHTLTVSNRAIDAILGGSSDSFVEGNLERTIARGGGNYHFPLGSGDFHALASLDFTLNSIERNVRGTTVHTNHPDIASSNLEGPKVERYWTFLTTGGGSYNYNPTFNWDSADEEEGFEFNEAMVARYNGSTWSYPEMLSKTTTSAIATGLTAFGAFQVGSENVDPDTGKATRLVLSGLIADLPSGEGRQFAATLKDATGNIIDTGAESSLEVVFSQSAGLGSVSGLATITAEDGIASITLVGEKAGQVIVKASTSFPVLIDELVFTITVDKSALQTATGATESLIEMDWSVDSWAVLQTAIVEAQTVLDNTNVKQSEIDAALVSINRAIAGLESDMSNINGVESLAAIEVEYGTTFADIATLPETVEVSLFSGDKEPVEIDWEEGGYDPAVLGEYKILGKLIIPADANFTNVSDLTAEITLTVKPKVITVIAIAQSKIYGADDPTEYGYALANGSTLVGADELGDLVSGSSREGGDHVGIYNILLTFGGAKAGNYGITFDEKNSAFGITPKPLTVTADDKIKTYGDSDPTLTYTLGSSLVGSDVFTGRLVRVAGEDVGAYAIGQGTLALNDNYELTFVSGNLRILQSESGDIGDISFEEKSVIYNGSSYTLEVRGLPEDATVTYENNGQTNAGSYTVTATISRSNHGDLTLTAILTIQKAQAVIAAEEIKEHVFDGTTKNISAKLNHGEATLSYSPQQGYINAGTYNIAVSAAETDNYLAASQQVTLVIRQGQAAEKPVLEGRTVSYDGKAHSLEIKNLPTGAKATYGNNKQVNAGTYEVTVMVTHPDYGEESLKATLTIRKAGQQISFAEIGTLSRDAGQVALSVSASSRLPVTVKGDNDLTATVDGTDLLIHRLGTVRLTATQEGDKNHEAAEPVSITVKVEDTADGDPIRVHQALSPNGDGINDFLILEGVKEYPDNKLTILTRNGLRVFFLDGYDNESRVFKGIGNFNSSSGTLPQGTYFYVLEYQNGGERKVKKGWFVLKM